MYTKTMNINFPMDLAEGLTNLSVEVGRPRTKIIFEACREYLSKTPTTTHETPPPQKDEWVPVDFLSSSGTGIV